LTEVTPQGREVSRISASFPSYAFEPNKPLLKTCIIGKSKLVIEALIDTGATSGNFVNYETIQLIYKKEGISPVRLPRAKEITRYTREPAPGSDYTIYLTIEIQGYYNQCTLYITTLYRLIIISKV
jgi:hypothetical protein